MGPMGAPQGPGPEPDQAQGSGPIDMGPHGPGWGADDCMTQMALAIGAFGPWGLNASLHHRATFGHLRAPCDLAGAKGSEQGPRFP